MPTLPTFDEAVARDAAASRPPRTWWLAALLPVLISGCSDSNALPPTLGPDGSITVQKWDETNLDFAVNALNRASEFANFRKYRQAESRQRVFDQAQEWIESGQPPLAWLPSPLQDARDETVGRLNQWLRVQDLAAGWQPDPMIDTLDEPYRQLPQVAQLGELRFTPYDADVLQEAVWLRETAARAGGKAIGDVPQAAALFDWVVRNVQLVEEGAATPPFPWQTLFLPRGTAQQRAWIFALLARQQRLEVVLLALPPEDPAEAPRFWLPALFSEGQLYLFDTRLGRPIFNSQGNIATLEEAAADDALLRALDTEEAAYPVSAEDLRQVIALVEASPVYLSRRMHELQRRLTGVEQLVLVVEPTRLADALRKSPQVAEVRLWQYPYEVLRAQQTMDAEAREAAWQEFLPLVSSAPLWRGRMMHLEGKIEGDTAAGSQYHRARPSDERIANSTVADPIKAGRRSAKELATVFLGLLTFELGNFDAAIDYFSNRMPEEAAYGPLAAYNLGRAYESAATEAGDEAQQRHEQALAKEGEAQRFQKSAESARADGNAALAQSLEAQAKALRGEAQELRRQQHEHQRRVVALLEQAVPCYELPGPQYHGNWLRRREVLQRIEALRAELPPAPAPGDPDEPGEQPAKPAADDPELPNSEAPKSEAPAGD